MAFIRRWERSSFLRSVDAVIAYSQVGAQQYRQFGFVPDRVYVASNAISPAPCSLPPVRTAEFDQKPTVLFVGRLQARKRLDLLLRACSNLPKDIQPRLVIVGDGPARSELQSLAFQLYPQAEFIGARHGREAEPYFKAADLFVLPGTGGLAIQQAMAFALPVIVARGDGTQDDLVRSENGWQIPADDLPALTAALRMALADAKKLRQMGAASFRIVSEEINVQKMVQAFVTALNDLSQVRA
jgi:glycosyltransferase involved in cell wall biosynthesis